MRHYVGSQGELVELATRAVADRVAARVQGHRSVEGPDDLVELLAEVVPLDAERRAETEVWLALVAESRTDPRLVPLAREHARRPTLRASSARHRLSRSGPPAQSGTALATGRAAKSPRATRTRSSSPTSRSAGSATTAPSARCTIA